MDDKDVKELLDIFYGTLSLDEKHEEHESKRFLTSGSSHYRLDPKPTTTLTSTAVSTTQMTQVFANISTIATLIKILPTTASVRSYSGAETDYSAREFIGQCEAVMQNASVIEPGNKITFVKSNLQPGLWIHAIINVFGSHKKQWL